MLLLIGDSHAIAMREALTIMDDDLKDRLRESFGDVAAGMIETAGKLKLPFHTMKDTRVTFPDDALHKRIDAIAGLTVTLGKDFQGILGISGGFHFTGLMKKSFWRGYSVLLKDGKHFVTRAVLGELIDRHAIGIRRLLRDLAFLGIRCFLMEGPPVKQRYVSARKNMSLDEILCLDAMLRQSRYSFAGRLGIPVITFPGHVAEGGVLKERFESPTDIHHGNDLYGVEMWREILRHAPLLKGDGPKRSSQP